MEKTWLVFVKHIENSSWQSANLETYAILTFRFQMLFMIRMQKPPGPGKEALLLPHLKSKNSDQRICKGLKLSSSTSRTMKTKRSWHFYYNDKWGKRSLSTHWHQMKNCFRNSFLKSQNPVYWCHALLRFFALNCNSCLMWSQLVSVYNLIPISYIANISHWMYHLNTPPVIITSSLYE